MTYDEYLRAERQSTVKHEWIDGQVFAMVGGTPEHARLQAALSRVLGNAIGETDPDDRDAVTNPTLFRRGEGGRWEFVEAGAGDSLRLESIGCTISVDDVFAKRAMSNEA